MGPGGLVPTQRAGDVANSIKAKQEQEAKQKQEEAQRKMAELKQKSEEMRKAKAEADTKRAEGMQAANKIRALFPKVRAATPDNFDELRAELEVTMEEELPNCGDQKDQVT